MGTPDGGGGAVNSVASVKMSVVLDPQDFLLTFNATDIRCRPAGPPDFCGVTNASGGPDYSGEISLQASLRITDHWNSRVQFPPPRGSQHATRHRRGRRVVAAPIASCASTASTSIGGTCSVSTSGNAIAPTFSPAVGGKRFLMEIGQLQVFDGGSDGIAFFGGPAGADTLFGVQGIFIP